MDRDGRRLLLSPENFYEAEDDLSGRHCFGSVLGRPDSTTAYGPLRPGPAGHVQRWPSPVGGGSAEHLEMAECLIFKRLLKIISNRRAENAKRPGKPPFSDFQGHFHRHEGRLDCWTSRAVRWRGEPSSDEAPAVISHPGEPTLPLGIACRIDHPEQWLVDRGNAGKFEDGTFGAGRGRGTRRNLSRH
jgi:hypothetical protein